MALTIERKPNPVGDWPDRVLVLWQEDDALVPDRERPLEALARISGRQDAEWIITRTNEDHALTLYYGGWVLIGWPEGGAVGVVVAEA